jgi:hypothetical protein
MSENNPSDNLTMNGLGSDDEFVMVNTPSESVVEEMDEDTIILTSRRETLPASPIPIEKAFDLLPWIRAIEANLDWHPLNMNKNGEGPSTTTNNAVTIANTSSPQDVPSWFTRYDTVTKINGTVHPTANVFLSSSINHEVAISGLPKLPAEIFVEAYEENGHPFGHQHARYVPIQRKPEGSDDSLVSLVLGAMSLQADEWRRSGNETEADILQAYCNWEALVALVTVT